MKFAFESEDSLVGIGIGALILGFTGKYYNVPDIPILWGVVFGFSLLMTFLDVIHTFHDLSFHPMLIFLSFLNNVIDGILELAFIAKFFSFNIPYVTQYVVPYLSGENNLFMIATFFIVTSTFWLVMWPFTS